MNVTVESDGAEKISLAIPKLATSNETGMITYQFPSYVVSFNEKPEIKKGDEGYWLVKAAFQWSSCLISRAKFKKGCNDLNHFAESIQNKLRKELKKDNYHHASFEEIKQLARRILENKIGFSNSPHDFDTNIEPTDYNPFGKRGKFSAMIFQDEEHRPSGRGSYRVPVEETCISIVFGQYDDVYSYLLGSKEVKELLKRSEEGTLWVADMRGIEMGKAASYRKVDIDTGFSSIAEELLRLSVHQALAEPPSKFKEYEGKGKKLSALVARIFKDHAQRYLNQYDYGRKKILPPEADTILEVIDKTVEYPLSDSDYMKILDELDIESERNKLLKIKSTMSLEAFSEYLERWIRGLIRDDSFPIRP